jgi:hypothetical protein
MTKTKSREQHTPGPWEISIIRGTQDKNNIYITSQDKDKDFFCSVSNYGPFDPDRILRADANARLICAAPDLLAACKAILDNQAGGETLCRAAVAKAEG